VMFRNAISDYGGKCWNEIPLKNPKHIIYHLVVMFRHGMFFVISGNSHPFYPSLLHLLNHLVGCETSWISCGNMVTIHWLHWNISGFLWVKQI
jgi:hypothetical protein